jgi:ATP-binding cassette subfamily B protein
VVRSRASDLALYRRLLADSRPYWPHLAGLLVLSLVSAPIRLLSPLPLKIAVDSVIGSRPLPEVAGALLPPAAHAGPRLLLLLAGLVLAIALLGQLQDLATSVLRIYTGERLVLGFRTRLFRHVQRLSLAYHDTKGAYDSTYRVHYDAMAPQKIITEGLVPSLGSGVTIVGMIYVTARIDWQLALVALAVTPLLFLLARVYRPRLRQQWREVRELDSAALSVVQEVLGAVRVVKAFGQEDREEERFVRRARESVWANVRTVAVEGSMGVLVALTTALGMAALLFIGVRDVESGALSLGDLLLVMGYLTQLYDPLRSLGKKLASAQSSLASAERAFALLDQPFDVPERPDARPLDRAAGAVTFRHVSFAYDDGRPVLADISFEVGPGTRLGIAGTTGAGKTTLVNLLTRSYDPTAGQILLDGVDLRDYRLADLRNQYAIVLQEPVLFSTSVAENIAYARLGASMDDVVAAARAANIHEAILRLPRGYDTPVGERGLRLSGGERQRIALARAFLKDAPVLILDEPTSSVDTRTEAAIMEAMERLMRGRTTFMIAHRLGTLAGCDVRIEIEQGRLVGGRSRMAGIPTGALVARGLGPARREGVADA